MLAAIGTARTYPLWNGEEDDTIWGPGNTLLVVVVDLGQFSFRG